MVEIDEGVHGPELFLKVFARDNFAGALQKNREDLKRLALQANPVARSVQLS
jgi:hypothetical protein